MRDVFKYLKDSRKLLESTTSERAAELGYEYRSRGVWGDPRTGKRYRTDGTRFVEIEEPKKKERDPKEQEPKTLSQFKKDVPQQKQPEEEVPSVVNQMDRVVPGGPTETVISSGDQKTVEKQLSRGRENVQSPERKKQVAQQASDIIAQLQAEKEAEEKAELEAEAQTQDELEKEMGTPEGPLKEPEEFRTIDQVIVDNRVEEGKNFDNSIAQGDVDIATDESIQRITDISNTDVDDERFESGRQAQKQFLDHYSQDSEYRSGLNVLSKSVAKANDRTKVNEMMDAINSGDFEREIPLTKTSSKTVGELLGDAGIDVNNEEQVKQFSDAYNEISSFIGSDGYWKRGESHELVGSNLGYYEAKHIAEREDLKELDPSGVQTKAFNLSSESQSPLAGLDPVVTDAVFSILPTPSRDFLSKSGSPKTFYNPTEKGEQSKTANPIRGSAALHMWGMQDGKDAYALSGQRRSPGEFQVEHITPLKSGGRDHIENFGMLLRRVNEPRADLSFDKFSEQAKRKRDSVDADLANPKTRERLETSYRASSFNSELGSLLGGDVSSLISDDIMNSVNSGLVSKLGQSSAEALKVTPESYKEYQSKMQGFLKKENLPPNTQVKDMNSNQINGVFDIMSESLGVDKSKMNEYMGRNLINNYDAGARFVINKDGKLERGRGGTSPTSGAVLNMQNSIMSDDNMSPEEKTGAIKQANEYHQQFKKSRANYIDNPDNPESYEGYLSDIVSNVDYLTGEGDSPLTPGRKYDTRLTYSSKNNIDNDTTNAIMSMLSLDSASVAGGKDAFSPGFQKVGLTPKSKEYIKSLRSKLVSSYIKTSGFTEDQIKNPDSLTKTNRKKIEPLISALENIDRGLGS
jgi:hypothetical protein